LEGNLFNALILNLQKEKNIPAVIIDVPVFFY
jgi:hypothetical protein